MIILPAIDIKDGKCVRLVKGDYATAHQMAESPYDTAAAFRAAGAAWIHMVDLDGAKEGKPVKVVGHGGFAVQRQNLFRLQGRLLFLRD